MAHEPEDKPIQESGASPSIPSKESGPIQTDLPLMGGETAPASQKESISSPPPSDLPTPSVPVVDESHSSVTPVTNSAAVPVSSEPVIDPHPEEKDADYYHRQHEQHEQHGQHGQHGQHDEYHDYSGQHGHHDTGYDSTGYDSHHHDSGASGGGSTGYVPPPPSEPDPAPTEEGGGPVKAFLDHLEDFRWVLIKVISSVVVAMMICLVGGNWLVGVLTYPLSVAQKLYTRQQTTVPLFLGTNQLSKIRLEDLKRYHAGTNRIDSLQFAPVTIGTNTVLAIQPGPKREDFPSKRLVGLINLSPLSAIMVALKLAFYGGIVIAAPFIIFFIGQFVLPALRIREKSILYQVAGFGSVLFLLGVAFCYFVILPITVTASVEFSDWLGFSAEEWQAEEYIGFACKFMVAMGLGFQLPVIILTLVKVGLLDHKKLNAFRRYWIVINLVLSAVITPSGDPLTMLIFAAPLHILYEFCIVVAWFWNWRDRRRKKTDSSA